MEFISFYKDILLFDYNVPEIIYTTQKGKSADNEWMKENWFM